MVPGVRTPSCSRQHIGFLQRGLARASRARESPGLNPSRDGKLITTERKVPLVTLESHFFSPHPGNQRLAS